MLVSVTRRRKISLVVALALVASLILVIGPSQPALRSPQVAVPDLTQSAKTTLQRLVPAAPQPACDSAALPASARTEAVPGRQTNIVHDGANLQVTEAAVRKPTQITTQSVCANSLPTLDQGMTNVTAGPRRGYVFLPHTTFGADLHISLPYDPGLIPAGLSAQDVYTYFYDPQLHKWQQLKRVTVDTSHATVTSLTNHFTTFINAAITTPDQPGSLNDDPTTIKDIKAANPGAGINLIGAPQAASDGSAHLSYPIQLPTGRHGQAPGLSLAYSSASVDGSGSGTADGWLGLGWDLALPTIAVDTKFGVPSYDPANETETYLLNGTELTPVANRGAPASRTPDKIFHNRVEGAFDKLIRHGGDPKSYWWEVVAKNGRRDFFGGDPQDGPVPAAQLTNASGDVFEWALQQTVDLDGNTVDYTYTHVTDPGVAGGTVAGTNIYPHTISYTGTPGTPGPYTVTFVRDRELPGFTRRPDASINARGGFVMATADLLKRIDITFDGQPVRSYALDYATGAFGKTLLQSVTQIGTDGTVFNTHAFSYYDDAQNASGNYTGFGAATTVSAGNDNVTAGLLGHGQASALSGAVTTSVGGHLYVGFNPVSPTKQFSAGAKVGFDTTSTDGVLAMIDLNGDGLPDKVFMQGGQAFIRLNTSQPGGQVTFSGQAAALPTLPAISHDSSNTFTFGAEAYLGANVFADHSQTTTSSDTYFQDVNGDGLPDLVSGGQVLFNHLDAAGLPTFTANSADTPVTIGGGTVDTTGLAGDLGDLRQQASANDPPVDTLRRWVAPFDGTVGITGDVALIQDTSQARAQYATADGVRVAIQHNGDELWSTAIAATDYTPKTPTGVDALAVHKGDRIYFRVQSNDDGKYDQVSWNPTIAYQNVTPYTDVNNLDVYAYQAGKDFTLAGRRGAMVQAPLDGTVHLSGTFHKLGTTTDDVTVRVLVNGGSVFSQSLSWDRTGDIPVDQDLTVHKGDTIALRVQTDSPIDVTQVSWAPQLYYTSSPSGTVTDSNGNPTVQLHPPYDADLYPNDDLGGTPQQAWTVPADGTVHVTPTLTAAAGTNGSIAFTVKRRGALVDKHSITVTDGAIGDASFDLAVNQGDQLFFDFSAADPALGKAINAQSVQVAYPGQDPTAVPSALHFAADTGLLPEAFRGWAYAGYNGNGDRATRPVNEADLDQTFTSNTQYEPRTANAYLFNPSPVDNSWLGPNNDVFVKPASASSSRLGSPTISVPSAADFAGARAVSKLSQTSQDAVGGGVSLLSGSASTGSTSSEVDYIDLNGDGYPDVVSNGQVQYSTPTGGLEPNSVAVPGLGKPRASSASSANVGVGGSPASFTANANGQVDNPGHPPQENTTGSEMVSLGLSGSLGKGESHPQYDLTDVNGDGLPDVVTRSGSQLMVSLNLGRSFAPAEAWGAGALGDGSSENGSIGATLGFNDGIYDFAGGASLSKNKSQTGEELADINGDGLPDRVINTAAGIQVALNTGTGFADPVAWPGAPNGACADDTSVGLAGIDWNAARICNGDTTLGAGAYFTVGIGPLCLVGCYIIVNPGADASQTVAREEANLRDVNGDGIPDYVSSTSDGQLTVSLSDIGRTNLLKTVTRPLGATVTLGYQRSGNTYDQPGQRWVMSSVAVNDAHPGDGVDTQLTSYSYAGGRYDRLERGFYGYATVTAHNLDPANGNAVFRTTVNDYLNDSYYDQGLLARTRVYDAAGRLFTDTQQTYLLRDVGTGAEPANPASTTATEFPMLVRTDQFFYEGGTSAQKSTYTTQHYDALGNVDQSFDAGDPGGADDLATTTSYASCPDSYLMSTPVAVTVTGGGTVMRHREQTVDCATGNVTQIRQFLADGTAAVTDMTYFPNGNLATVTNPPNANGQRYTLSYTYDPTVATYLAQTTDSFGLSTTSTTDLRFGTTQSDTDANGNTTSYVFDEFGRTVSVTGPYQQGTGVATITFEYHPDATVPWAITRHADVFNGPTTTIDTVTFIDGLERTIQTKKTATVFTGADSAPANVMTVSGHITFDFLGRTVATAYPTTEPRGTAGVFNTGVDPVTPTTYTYDVLDRQTSVTMPDGTTTATSYGFGADRSGTTQFMTAATDPNGHVKKTFRDVRQQMVGSEAFHNGQPVWTSYAYDPMSQLLQTTDDQGNATTQTFDNLGHRTAVSNPDTGRVESVYDLASNQIARITPDLRAHGKQIRYRFDFNRLVAIEYPVNPENDVTYVYGAPGAPDNAAGRIVQVTDVAGITQRSYGKLGEVTKEVEAINVGFSTHDALPVSATLDVFRPTYITRYTYDTFGRLQQLVYPDGETLTYHYDTGGLVNQVTGVKGKFTYTYVSRLEYDKFDDRAFLESGNNVRTAYSYNPLNRRLAGVQSGPDGGSPFQNTSYSYDNVGNLVGESNNVATPPFDNGNGPVSQTFGYDDLDRLTSAAGTYTFAPKTTDQYTLSLSYDSLSNLTTKKQTNQIVLPSGLSLTQDDTTYTFNYAYSGSQPNAPTQIGAQAASYDANGNQTSVQNTHNIFDRRTIVWDEENRIQTFVNDGLETDYAYDDSGQRVIKRGLDGETVYVNQYFTIRNGQIGTKQIIVGGKLVAAKLMDPSGLFFEDDQFYFHGDQVGSTSYITGRHAELLNHQEYFPSGETWVQQSEGDTTLVPYGFNGKLFDQESGYYYYGARYYDPRTGIFESPDPSIPSKLAELPEDTSAPSSLDTFAPTFLNLYNYADDRPLTETDADGLQSQQNLTTGLLRQIANAQGIGSGLSGVQYNRAVGRAFQATALDLVGRAIAGAPMPENTTPYSSPAKGAAEGFVPPSSAVVIPDAVAGLQYIQIGEGGVQQTRAFKDSAFFEVKAVNAPFPWGIPMPFFGLGLSYSKSQIRGLVDVASRSPAGRAGLPGLVVFLTTSNTDISLATIARATASNVAIWQAKAYAVQDSTGAWVIGFDTPVLLNPEVYAANRLLPLPPFPATPLGTLRSPPNARTAADPDPTTVQP